MRFSLAHVLEWAGLPPDGAGLPHLAQPFAAVSMSSRADGWPPMRPGGLFVAVRGDRRDGHDFVADAFASGAGAALVDHVPPALAQGVADGDVALVNLSSGFAPAAPVARASSQASTDAPTPVLLLVDPGRGTMGALMDLGGWWRRRWGRPVVAIAGSVGKTTTKDLVAAVLGCRFRTLATAGNLNNELGLPITLLGLDDSHEIAAVEIGISAPGEMATFAAAAAPNIVAITRVEAEHLEFLHDIDTVAREEGGAVEALAPGGVAVLNADDERVAAMAARAPGRVATYGISPAAATRAEAVRSLGLEGVTFRLVHDGRATTVRLPLAGRHFVGPALAAAAVGFAAGCGWDAVVTGLEAPPASPRVRVTRPRDGLVVIDDTYNASPASCVAALDLLAEADGTRVAVLGDMLELGGFAREAHAQVGAHAFGRADFVVAVGEDSLETARAAIGAGADPGAVAWVPRAADAAEALHAWRRASGASDVLFVLVKGSRGMRMEEAARAISARV